MSRTSGIPLIAHAAPHGERTAIVDSQGSYTYSDLLDASARVATALLDGGADLREERVAFLATPGFAWVAMQWGIWRAGGIAVPLPLNSTQAELEYFVDDTRAIDIGVRCSGGDPAGANCRQHVVSALCRTTRFSLANQQSCRTSATIGVP